MNEHRPPTQEDFAAVACWAREYLELTYTPKLARVFHDLLRALSRLATLPRDGTDRFDALRAGEKRVSELLREFAEVAAQAVGAEQANEWLAGDGDARETTLLFVYGTLKRGHQRHGALADQQFLGTARTVPRYRLFDCGGYPGLVDGEPGCEVEGELWQVEAERLALLDEIEGVDVHLYRRSGVQLAPPHDALRVESYFYCRNTKGLRDCGTCW